MTEATYFVDATAEGVAARAARYFADAVQSAVAARGVARIAISGGNTPRRTFELLADPKAPYLKQVPWGNLEIYWVDERAVPPDSPDSNYRMTRQAMLDRVPLNAAQIIRIQGELDPEEAAAKYESAIRGRFRLEGAEIPSFDLLALGLGPDGHTASLFPHTEALHEFLRIAVANHVPSQKYSWRITLTWPVINQARDVFFVIEGSDKAPPLREVLLGARNPDQFPAQLIRPRNGRITLLLDSAAAALLPPPAANGAGKLELA
jgi:6-phosphogluconolactonase